VTESKVHIYVVLLLIVVILNLPIPMSMRIKDSATSSYAPFQNVMTLVLVRCKEAVFFTMKAGEAYDRKVELESKLTELQLVIAQLQSMQVENERFRKMLDLQNRASARLVVCEVLGRDISGWWDTIRLNKGSASGVKPGMPVIDTEGLVGRILEVTEHTADVMLVSDRKSMVSCRIKATGDTGIVKGAGIKLSGTPQLRILCAPNPFTADYLSVTSNIPVGEAVVTTGDGGVFPEGILIGRVGEVLRDSSGLYQTARVVPAVDLGRIKYVFVVAGRK